MVTTNPRKSLINSMPLIFPKDSSNVLKGTNKTLSVTHWLPKTPWISCRHLFITTMGNLPRFIQRWHLIKVIRLKITQRNPSKGTRLADKHGLFQTKTRKSNICIHHLTNLRYWATPSFMDFFGVDWQTTEHHEMAIEADYSTVKSDKMKPHSLEVWV